VLSALLGGSCQHEPFVARLKLGEGDGHVVLAEAKEHWSQLNE